MNMMKSKESSMKTNRLTENEKILVRELIAVWKDIEFVLGVICTLRGDDEVQAMIDYIRDGDFDSPSDITTEALFLANQRK